MFKNAVFQGGGVKGIALAGALQKLDEMGVQFTAVCGTSAGAIVASLYAAGYTAQEMKELLETTAFDQLLDSPRMKYLSFIRRKGLYRSNQVYEWLYHNLKKKGVVHFQDLSGVDLKIVASDLTNREILIFDKTKHPTMKIAEAVRMSISIPLFFEPYKLGERLVVDGGILSNYPLSIFNEFDATVGFKLISKNPAIPKAPSTFFGYVFALVNTMMDAHDKEDENQAGHKNTIHIDNCGIATTKFDLTSSEKDHLYNSGYYAASQFTIEQVEVLTRGEYISINSPFSEPLNVHKPKGLHPDDLVRVSISGLFRIKIDGKYLLVLGNRIPQFQPVGGVLKRLPKATYKLSELGVLDDDKLPIDNASRGDLRVRVPLKHLPQFLEWYRTSSGRETTPDREFREELLETSLLPSDKFKYIFHEHVRTHVSGIGWSPHFNSHEVLIAEIYELNATPEQEELLIDLQTKPSEKYIWCDETVIRSKGYDERTKHDVGRISETAIWTL
jgi:NTE family protein